MKQKLLFILTLLILWLSWGWGAVDPTQIYVSGFENGTGTWSSPNGSVESETTQIRTGSKSLKYVYTSGTGEKNKTQSTGSSISGNSTTYCHIIAWAKAESGSATTGRIGFTSSKKSDGVSLSASEWKRLTYTGNSVSPSTVIIYKNGATTGVYYDDIVAYANSSNTIDLTPPTAASDVEASTTEITWANGSDTGTGATGIQATLIFHRTGGSVGAKDLTLNNQGLYSLTATEGPKVVGNWTLISASVAANSTSYSGTFVDGDEYAIVHRDLAYNYSTPTYVVAEGGSSGYRISYNANGGEGNMASNTGIVENGSQTLTANSFTKTGSTFANWTADVDVTINSATVAAGDPIEDGATITDITSDINLTAQWTAIDYNITHTAAANGTYTIQVADETPTGENTTANYGQTITLVASPSSGFTLSAWNVTSGGEPVEMLTSNTFSMPAAAVTIAPTFAQVYTVTYDGNGKTGGSVPVDSNSPYANNAEVTVLDNTGSLVKTDYTFIGWNTESDGTGTTYYAGDKFNISANTTLYAQWGISLTWNVQVNEAETTVTTTSTVSSNTDFVANPSNLTLTGLTVTSDKKGTATNKISTTKDKSGYVSATFDIEDGYVFVPTRMVLKTTAITEAITIEVNVGDEVQTWAQPKSGSSPDEHSYVFSSPREYTGSVTMKIYAYGGSDGTKGFRLGTPITIYGTVEPVPTNISVSIGSREWASFSSTYPLDFTGSGITAYKATADDGTAIHLQAVTKAPAMTGLLLNGTEGSHTVAVTSESIDDVADNLLKAGPKTVSAAEAEAGKIYAFGVKNNQVGFVKAAEGYSVAFGKSYLDLTESSAKGVEFFAVDDAIIDDYTTGIEAIHNSWLSQAAKPSAQFTIHTDAPMYNIAGQRVGENYKGIVIQNGKKYMRK